MNSKRIPRKRILSVTIRRMVDIDPDYSWIGEYSDKPANEFAIDMKHSLDCSSLEHVSATGKDWLRRIIAHLEHETWQFEGDEYESALADVQNLLDSLTECDCNGGDWERGNFQYFNSASVDLKHNTPEENRKYAEQDYNRMQAYNRGVWCFMGIRAEAEVMPNTHSDGNGKWHGVWHKITSGGLWGIESDSDAEYIAEVEQQELASLKDELRAFGFSTRAISKAFQDVQRKGG